MIFVVVPAYNEEETIGRVIRGLFEQGFMQVVVVDDGSDDRTGEEAKAVGAVVLKHPVNRGQGAALQTGNEYALRKEGDVVVHFDADGQFNPADIVGAVRALKSQALDVVLGSRFLDSRSRIPWLKRYVVFPISRWINFVFTGVKLTDAHNGFRVLNRRALKNIQITQDGMAHNSEIVSQIRKKNLRFVEVPVEVIYHEYGQGVGGGVRILLDLLLGIFDI